MQKHSRTPELVPFGKYLLGEEIARGGMARVYSARLRGLGGFEKKLVVKQVLPELASDPRFVEMFVEEAKRLVEMSHPNVVTVYELGIADGVYFLAMEHVEGATLAEILRTAPLPSPLVAHLGSQVADALHYAHTRFGLVHRDVTPRNIIIDPSGHVRLLDFGIAAPSKVTATGEVFGSHGYMSPEQARGEQLTERSDLFSLGAVLYEALSGVPAFLKQSPEETREALLSAPTPRLDPDSNVSPLLGDVVSSLLKFASNDRPASADEVGKRLRSWLSANHPEGVAHELGLRADAARKQRRPSNRPPPISATGREPTNGGLKTFATSQVLTAMLEHETAPSQTVPIERPTKNLPTVSSEGGQTIRATVERPVPPRTSRVLSRLFGLLAIGLVALSAVAIGRYARENPAQPPSGETSLHPTKRAREVARKAEREAQRHADIPQKVANLEGSTSTRGPTEQTGGVLAPEPGKTHPIRTGEAGTLTVNATPWAEVALDGRPVGTTPQRSLAVPAGAHQLELECPPLGRRARVSFRVTAGQTVRVIANLTMEPPEVQVSHR